MIMILLRLLIRIVLADDLMYFIKTTPTPQKMKEMKSKMKALETENEQLKNRVGTLEASFAEEVGHRLCQYQRASCQFMTGSSSRMSFRFQVFVATARARPYRGPVRSKNTSCM